MIAAAGHAAHHGPLSVLHVIPRCSGGGAERALLDAITLSAASGGGHRHTVAVLDGGVAPALLFAARRAHATLALRPTFEELARAWDAHDVVVVHWWNHPLLCALLARPDLPPARVVLQAHTVGLHPPHVLTGALVEFADLVLVSSSCTLAAPALAPPPGGGQPPDVRLLLPVFSPDRLPANRRPGGQGTGIRVGYLGTVNEAKLHPRFAELSAAIDAPGVRVDVWGGGGGEDELRRRVADLHASDRVHVHGHTDDVAAAFASMDVFGYPLRADTYASADRALQEAMWAGVPPVVLAGAAAAALVEDGVTGIVTDERGYPGSVASLAHDPARRRRLAAGAAEFAREALDPRRAADRWVHALDAAARLPRRARPPVGGHPGLPGAASLFAAGMGAHARVLAGDAARRDPSSAAAVAALPSLLARCEGGVNHWANTFPDDLLLRRWAAILARPGSQTPR